VVEPGGQVGQGRIRVGWWCADAQASWWKTPNGACLLGGSIRTTSGGRGCGLACRVESGCPAECPPWRCKSWLGSPGGGPGLAARPRALARDPRPWPSRGRAL